MKDDNTILKFSINSWNHLYSLKAAIERQYNGRGNLLSIEGNIRNNPLNDHRDTPILIKFRNVQGKPDYETNSSGGLILGVLNNLDGQLQAQLSVNDDVFEELRKNLMEFGDIDGIHIVVSIELENKLDNNINQPLNILDVKYAMKGDA